MAGVALAEEVVAAIDSPLTMKKKQLKSAAATLATATCALLGTTALAPVQAQEEPEWEFDTALLYYGENDNRVQDVSLNVLALRNFVDDRILTLSLGVDTLTGATPIGAMPFNGPQTFTSPSGLAVATRPANEIPLDDTFLDTRYALSANWQQPWGRLNTVSAAAVCCPRNTTIFTWARTSKSRVILMNATQPCRLAWHSPAMNWTPSAAHRPR